MRPPNEYQQIFFDVDKTLTKSRSPMAPEHQEIFARLCAGRDVVVVTGGSRDQMREQVTPRFDGMYTALPQSGNLAIGKDGSEFWYDPLTDAQVEEIMRAIAELRKHFAITVRDENDIIDNRGAQVSYSVIGFHEDIEKKYAFDPTDTKRQAALKALPEMVTRLDAVGIIAVPAGTTVFNFIPKGKDKGHNVERLIERMDWSKEDCIYVGDALYPGGNDESVMDVIDTKAVETPDDTFRFVEEILS